MLPCLRQQSAWAVTRVVFCSDGQHEWMHLQRFRIILESREVQKMLVTFFLAYLQEASWKKCEREIFPLVDQLKLQISLSSLVIAIICEVCKLVLQWTNEEDMGEINQSGLKKYTHSENLKLGMLLYTKLNRTGYMLTLIGAVQSTGGYCLLFSGSQIAALTMPKQETSDWMCALSLQRSIN